MKKVALFVLMASVVVVTVVGCGSNSPNSPSGNATQTYTATLNPLQEVPAVIGPEAAGSGTATITLNVSKDASGNVTAATATFAVNLSGFPAGTPINMA